MLNKTRKRFGGLLLALAVFLSLSMTAYAAGDLIDLDATGSVTVRPKSVEEHEVVKGTTFTIYQVGEVQDADGALSYVLTGDFSGSGADLSALETEGLAETLADYADANGITGTERSASSDGTVTFSNLALGVYLLVDSGSGEEYEVDPFLVTLPQMKAGEYVYDVDASPKTEATTLTDITVTKVWNDGKSKSRPSSISVTLSRGDEKVETVTLNEANDWAYTWTGLARSDDYSVQETEVKGYVATYTKSGGDFTVTNTNKLPQTGQLNWPVPVLAAAGMCLLLAGWALKAGKSRD